MKTTNILLAAITAITIAACSTTKKTTTATAPATTTPPSPFVANPATGIHAPGNEELTAIHSKYPEATMDMLNEGHMLYTQGACIKCHGAKNIYDFQATDWRDIIDNMAIKARISDTQREAVYKYILAIKATQPK